VEALARHRNYRRAALELGVSQSQLSRTIQSLEREFGFALFERTRQSVSITRSGAQVLSEAEILFKAQDAFAARVAAIRSKSTDEVRIGVGPWVSRTWEPRAIAELARTRPEISISMREMDWWKLADAALGDEFDMVLGESGEIERIPEIIVERFPERPAGVFVRAGHPLANRNEVTLDQIAQFPLAAPRLPPRAAQVFPTAGKLGRLSDDGRYFLPRIECATPRSVIGAALASDAVCIALKGLCAGEIGSGTIVELPFHPPWLHVRQAIMYARGRPLSGAALAFRTAARVAERKYFCEPETA